MKKEPAIKRYSAQDLEARRTRGESQTDLARLRTQTAKDIDDAIATDPDWSAIPPNWHEQAEAITPTPKRLLSLRLDEDVLAWFRSQGPGYQTRINAVLRIFMKQQRDPQPE